MAMLIAGLNPAGYVTDKTPDDPQPLARAILEMQLQSAPATAAAEAGEPVRGIYPAYRETTTPDLIATSYTWEWREVDGLQARVHVVATTRPAPTPEEIAAAEAEALQEIKTAAAEKRAVKLAMEQMLIADELADDQIAEIVDVFGGWSYPVEYTTNDICRYDGVAYRCVQAHTSQADWTPDAVPALWSSYAPAGVIPEWVQPTGEQDAYNTGDRVTFNGGIWESVIDANTWSPAVYPAGWNRIGDA